MENRDVKNPSAGRSGEYQAQQQGQQSEAARNQQQSQFGQQQPESGQQQQQPEAGQQQSPETSQDFETGQSDYGGAEQGEGQSDAISQQRSDIEGGTSTDQSGSASQSSDIEGTSSFVGSQGSSDMSSDLIEDDDSSDFAKDGQGASE